MTTGGIILTIVATILFVAAAIWAVYQIVKDNKRKRMEQEKIAEEWRKCEESPYYYFKYYFTLNGQKPVIHKSEKEFNDEFYTLMGLGLHKQIKQLKRRS